MPFSATRQQFKLPEGLTIQEMIDIIQPDARLKEYGHVFIDDEYIPQSQWSVAKPQEGQLVSLRLLLGKGGGGKNPLSTILSIAVLAAAGPLSSALLSGVLFPTAASGLFAGALVRGVISAVGSLLVNAIAPPPSPKLNKLSGGFQSDQESPTLFIEGARNELVKFGVVPVVLGTHRIVPPLAARTYTETSDNDQYVRQLFLLGYGEELVISQQKIGETDLADFEGVDTETILDGNSTGALSLYSNSIFQEDLSINVLQADGWSSRTSQDNADEIILDITFPQGLVTFNSQGKKENRQVVLEYRYGIAGVSPQSWSTDSVTYSASTSAALRKQIRITGLSGTDAYDVEVRRTTADTDDSQIFDDSYWTSLKTVTYENPVNMDGVNLVAMRIKATDQLNGAVDQYNLVVSNKILDYDAAASPPAWSRAVTSNPASIMRYILQGTPNERALADSRIDLDQLEYWHGVNVTEGYEYNGVIDYETTVRNLLLDVCAAGRASPTIIDGKWSVVIDEEKTTPVQHFTPKNSWGYQGEKAFIDIPHAFRVQFINEEEGYHQDERIVYDDGYDANTATKYERLELIGITSPDLAWKHGRQHIATLRLRPEVHSFNVDAEHLVATRGDLIRFQHDVPLFGVSAGRVTTVTTDGGSPELVTSVTVDEACPMTGGNFYSIRFRKADGTTLLKGVNTVAGDNNFTLTFTTPFDVADAPEIGDLMMFGETTRETIELVIQKIEPGPDFTAKLYCVDHSPAIFDASTGAIPAFNTQITPPPEMQRPTKPTIQSIQTGEEVMVRNIDGSISTRMVINLENPNAGIVIPIVETRNANDTEFVKATILFTTGNQIILEGFDDGERYDIRIKYRRPGSPILRTGDLYSEWATSNNVLFEGASALPDDVTNFRLTATSGTAILTWNAVTNIDFERYEIRFSPELSGVTWGSAQVIDEDVRTNRYTTPLMIGTYLVKARDRSGFFSQNATLVSTNIAAIEGLNVIETLVEQPTFSGSKTNVVVDTGTLIIDDPSAGAGTYLFDNTIDLGEKYTCKVTPNIVARGENPSDTLDTWGVLDTVDSLSGGVDPSSWRVTLQIRITDDDPSGSPVTWSAWENILVGDYSFRAAEFRVIMTSDADNITPVISKLEVAIDMPDRIYAENDLTVTTAGLAVSYVPAFKAKPKLVITAQDLQTGDYWTLTSQSRTGFTVTFYDSTDTEVERTMDYIATGYGREAL